MPRRFAAMLSALVLILGGALRLHQLQSAGGRYAPHVEHEEGYYEAGLAQLSCHSLSLITNTAPSDYLAPIYPSFLALSEAFFARPSPYHPRSAQMLLSTLAVAAACLLGWYLFSPLAGIIAGALFAFNVDAILEVSKLNVHGFYGISLLALGSALVLWLERRDIWRAGFLGMMLAATLLCRAVHFPFPLLLAAACLWRWKFPEGRWRALLPVAAAAALFLAPMAIRNGLQFGNYSPFDLKGSCVLVSATIGVYEATTVRQAIEAAEAIEPGFKARGLEGRALHTELIRLAMRQIARAPWAYAGYCLQRLYLFWGGLWPYLVLGAFALLRRRGDRPLEALILTAASLSGYAAAGGAPQYNAAAVPLLCVVAGAGLASFLSWKNAAESESVRRRLRAGVAVLPGVFAIVYAGMLVFLALELRDHLRPEPTALVTSDSCPDGRALSALDLASRQAGDRGVEALIYVEHASRALEYGADARRPRAVLNGLLKRAPADAELLLQTAELEIRAGQRAAALRALARAEAAKPVTDEQRHRIGGHYWRLKDYRSALVILEPLLARRPGDTGLLIDLAVLQMRVGERGPALKSLARAEGARSLTAPLRARIVELHAEQEKYERERAARGPIFQASLPPRPAVPAPPLRASPDGAWLWLQRAERETRAGERGKALSSLAKTETSKPDDDARRRAALLYRELKEPARALAVLTPLLESQPKDVELWLERAELEAQMGAKVAALDSLSRADAADPEAGIEPRRRLALGYQSLGEYGQAVTILDGLIRRNPGEGAVYSDKGLCEYLNGDAGAAVSSLREAIKLKPDFLPAYLTLAAVHAANGRSAEALKVYDEGLARPGGDGDPLRAALADERRTLLSKEAR